MSRPLTPREVECKLALADIVEEQQEEQGENFPLNLSLWAERDPALMPDGKTAPITEKQREVFDEDKGPTGSWIACWVFISDEEMVKRKLLR
jgi:hypothetical protein